MPIGVVKPSVSRCPKIWGALQLSKTHADRLIDRIGLSVVLCTCYPQTDRLRGARLAHKFFQNSRLSRIAMSERLTKVPTPQGEVEGREVQIVESLERWSDVTLSDGTTFRAKINIVNVVRIDGQYDAQGNPSYMINAQPAIAMVHVPDELRKKG